MSSADLVLIVHFCYVVFVVGSLPVIWLGAWRKCACVRNRGGRELRLAASLWVVAESLLGVVCPLTAWENSLRQVETNHSFIQQWLHKIMFYTLPEGVLTVIYILFAGLVAVTFKSIPPAPRRNLD